MRRLLVLARWFGIKYWRRPKIASFHRGMFETVVKGSRLEGEVKFVHLLGPALAVMHSVVRVTLRGQTEPSASRDSMQFLVIGKHSGEWRGDGLMNARRLTMDQQLFLDDLDALPAEAQRQVSDLVALLKKRSFTSPRRSIRTRPRRAFGV
jgi:hypothetical protein